MSWKKTLAISAGALATLALIVGLGLIGWSAVAAQTPPSGWVPS